MGEVVMYGSVSVDGFVADESDQPGPLFDWLCSGSGENCRAKLVIAVP